MNQIFYIIATPIGNLEDITLRAIEALKVSDFIVCEDTRITSILLNKLNIKKELLSFNAYNEKNKVDIIVKKIVEGKIGSLVSDSGTPLICDPGQILINKLIEKEIKIVSIPGPSALLLALTLSGFPASSFVFEGFLPLKKGRQKKFLELASEEKTIVFYESPHRVEKTLNELNEYMPERKIAVCRELTKIYEEVWRGTPASILSDLSNKIVKGEFVFVISPKDWK